MFTLLKKNCHFNQLFAISVSGEWTYYTKMLIVLNSQVVIAKWLLQWHTCNDTRLCTLLGSNYVPFPSLCGEPFVFVPISCWYVLYKNNILKYSFLQKYVSRNAYSYGYHALVYGKELVEKVVVWNCLECMDLTS